MPLFRALTLAAIGLVSLAVSQSIDPNSVDLHTKTVWCTDQQASCPLICLQIPGASGSPVANTCEPTDLTYSCVCSNGIQPNASQYSETIPYFECTTYNIQCVNNCAQGDAACASACNTDHPCGAQDPVRVNLSTVTTSMMPSTTSGSIPTGTDTALFTTGLGGSGGAASTSAPASGTGSGASTLAVGLGQSYGLGIVVLGFVTGFYLFI